MPAAHNWSSWDYSGVVLVVRVAVDSATAAREETVSDERLQVYLATCAKCGHQQKTVKPWLHTPTCAKCGKAAMR